MLSIAQASAAATLCFCHCRPFPASHQHGRKRLLLMSAATCTLNAVFFFFGPFSYLGFSCFLPLESGFPVFFISFGPHSCLHSFADSSSLVPPIDDCFTTSSSVEGDSNVCRCLWLSLLERGAVTGIWWVEAAEAAGHFAPHRAALSLSGHLWAERRHAEAEETSLCL